MLERIKNWWNSNAADHELLGLDIQPESIKLVEITPNHSTLNVANIAIIPLPKDSNTGNELKNPETIGYILKDKLSELNINNKNVALAIPRSSVLIKEITVDKRLTNKEIESRVWLEANRHFPELVGEIYLDFTMTGPASTDQSQNNIMLTACRKDQIKPFLDLTAAAGLKPIVIDVCAFALDRILTLSIPNLSPLKTIALLNLDLNLSTFLVNHEKELVYNNNQTYDGKRLLTQVKEYLSKNQTPPAPGFTEVNTPPSALETSGSPDSEIYFNLLRDNLISHLRHTMHFFSATRPQINIEQLYLSGDCSLIPNLTLFIQREIGIPTLLANPFTNMNFSSAISKSEIEKNASIYMLSTGLALSKIPE